MPSSEACPNKVMFLLFNVARLFPSFDFLPSGYRRPDYQPLQPVTLLFLPFLAAGAGSEGLARSRRVGSSH
jgi:hypothetical protein